MKVVLLGSFPVSILLYETLFQQQQLCAVCFEESTLDTSGFSYKESIEQQGLSTFVISKENIVNQIIFF